MNCLKIFGEGCLREQEGDQSHRCPNRLKSQINVLSVQMAWSNMDAGCICIAIQDGVVAHADRLVLVLIFCR